MNTLARDALQKAKVLLLTSNPFYGYIACRFRLRETGDELPTMATDGLHLYYNPKFALSGTALNRVAEMAHEATHVYMKHLIRVFGLVPCVNYHRPDGVDPHDDCTWEIAQYAMDLAINPRLEAGGFKLRKPPDPFAAVFPEKEYEDCSFEEHYKRLVKEAKKSGKKKISYCGGSCSGVRPMPGKGGKALSPAEREQIDGEIQTTIRQAAAFARAAGLLPADIERMIGSLSAPKVSWQDVTRRFMQAIAKNDYRMMPPNRRYIHQGLYLPSLRSETVGSILLILDGSGSTYNVFPQFISEFGSILMDVRPETLHVMVWDTRCTWLRQFDGYSDETQSSLAAMQSEMGAGGGTVFTDCFNYFESETGVRPQVAIVLTDMEMAGWPEDPGYPVLWVATTDITGPFGETIKIEV